MSGKSRVQVCRTDGIENGECEIVDIDGTSIGVFNVDDEYYALENVCPHRGGPVCTGSVRGKLEAEWPGPGETERKYYSDELVVACPWHGWEFSIERSQHLGDPTISLRSFDTEVEDGTVYVWL